MLAVSPHENDHVSKSSEQSMHLNMEPELAELVPPEGELLGGGPVGDRLQPLRDLSHVVVRSRRRVAAALAARRDPVLGVQNERLPLADNFITLNELN